VEQREAGGGARSRIGVKARLARGAVARRPFSAIAAVAAALVFVLLAQSLASGQFAPLRLGGVRTIVNNGAASGQQPQQQQYLRIPTPIPGELDPAQTQFSAIAGTSPSDVWVAGSASSGAYAQGVNAGAIILHFDGSRWSSVAIPSSDPITGMTMVAPGDGWAVAGGDILRYINGAWQLYQTYPSGQANGSYLNSISMSSPDDGWIIGSQPGNGNGPDAGILLHYTGGQWTPYASPSFALNTLLLDVSMYASNDGWAVGSEFTNDTNAGVIAHYQDGVWTQVGTFSGSNLLRVSAAGPDEAWAVGIGGPSAGIIVHCLDGVCQQVPSPTPNILSVITSRSTSEGWIGGDGAVIFRRDGSQWTQRNPTYHQVSLTGLLAFSDRDGWAIGQSSGFSLPPGAVMFHCVNGVWQVYQLHVRVSG
jgi:hypothetical protein